MNTAQHLRQNLRQTTGQDRGPCMETAQAAGGGDTRIRPAQAAVRIHRPQPEPEHIAGSG
jgi:hypothetical protein